jgi:hypothetical protein
MLGSTYSQAAKGIHWAIALPKQEGYHHVVIVGDSKLRFYLLMPHLILEFN